MNHRFEEYLHEDTVVIVIDIEKEFEELLELSNSKKRIKNFTQQMNPLYIADYEDE